MSNPLLNPAEDPARSSLSTVPAWLETGLAALATLGVEPTVPGVADGFVVVDAEATDVPHHEPLRTTIVLLRDGAAPPELAAFVDRLVSRRGFPPRIAASLVSSDRTRAVVAPLDTLARIAGVVAASVGRDRPVLVIGDVVVEAAVARRSVVGGLRVERTGVLPSTPHAIPA